MKSEKTASNPVFTALNHLAHLNRSIAILGEELAAVRAAAVTEHVRALRALADEEEMASLDLVKVCEINADMDLLQNQARELEGTIKEEVLNLGASVKGMNLQAVYIPGRVSWDDKTLLGYAVGGHMEILAWRKIGQASVSLREVKA